MLFVLGGLGQRIAAQVVAEEQGGCAFHGDLETADGHDCFTRCVWVPF